MKTNFTLLIADRNPHVRTFLQREMTAAGYRVRLADNGREVPKWAFQVKSPFMIILDLVLPDADETLMLEHLLDRIPFMKNNARRLVVEVSGKVAGVIREQDLFFEMEKILSASIRNYGDL